MTPGVYETVYPTRSFRAICHVAGCGWPCHPHDTIRQAQACATAHHDQTHRTTP